jgi:hypothetical protein
MIGISELIFFVIVAALLLFVLIYLPYRNGKGPEIQDFLPIEDGENSQQLCEELHSKKAWKSLTKTEMLTIGDKLTAYCVVCHRYR